MRAQDRAAKHPVRPSSRLFCSAIAINGLLATLIGCNIGGGGSDAAGNGMEAGFAFLGALLAFGIIVLLGVIFAFARSLWSRYVLVTLAVMFGFAMLLVVLFSL